MPSAVFAAMAVWLSSGAIAFRSSAGARVGVLPVSVVPAAAAVLVVVVVVAIGRRNPRGAAIAVAPLAFLLIPWLPIPLPPAFLIWTGALTLPIWIGVALALVSVPFSDGAWHTYSTNSPRVQARHAVLAGCVVFGLAAWSASAAIPGGDEPHYLVITQSLLHDHDLDVENNYARGDYREYYGGPLTPDFRVRGRHGELYSIHAPGIPALVLPAFALGGYHAVVLLLVLISAAACALAWWLAWRATGSLSAAWFGWAVVVCAAPFLLESFTVYPDGPGAAIVLTAFWALWRIDAGDAVKTRGWLLHGTALAALPWMHTRFALLAAVLGVLIVLRLWHASHRAQIPAFLALPALSAAGWIASAYLMYGTLNPAAAYGGQSDTSLAFLPDGIGGLLFDQGFGLIATAPALAIAFVGLPRTRRFAIEWGVTAIVYAAAVGSYAMWWAGSSGPARFLVPLLLPLAVPLAIAWQGAASRGARVLMIVSLLFSAWLSAVLAAGGGGLLGYHSRNVYGMTPAPWIEWANTLVNLASALPAFVPRPGGTPLGTRLAAARDGFATAIPWLVCVAAAAYVTIRIGRKSGARLYEVAAGCVAAFAVATMAAASVGWWMHGGYHVEPLDAQLEVMRRLSHPHALPLDIMRARRVRDLEALKMRIEVPVDDPAGARAASASIPLLPAGSYLLSTRGTARSPGEIFAGADDEPFPLVLAAAAEWARGVTLDLPVAVRALTIRFAASAAPGAIDMRPLGRRPGAADLASLDRVAHHAAAYGQTRVFFLDDRTAPEPDGFWIWGAREGEIVFASGGHDLHVVIRNGAAANEVSVRTGGAEQRVSLNPGEQQPITIPAAPADHLSPTVIRTSAGFRPADVDARSQDRRLLGVYVVMPEHASR